MARDTLYAIGEALIDMIPSKSGCAFAEVPAFAPRCPLCGAILKIGIDHCHYCGAMLLSLIHI